MTEENDFEDRPKNIQELEYLLGMRDELHINAEVDTSHKKFLELIGRAEKFTKGQMVIITPHISNPLARFKTNLGGDIIFSFHPDKTSGTDSNVEMVFSKQRTGESENPEFYFDKNFKITESQAEQVFVSARRLGKQELAKQYGGFATVEMEYDARSRQERRGHKVKPGKKNQEYLKLRKGKW